MMAVLWNDIAHDLAQAKHHFGRATDIYDRHFAGAGATVDYMPAMAFQHAMQSGYTAFEVALKRLMSMLDETLPVGSDSHAVLVRRLGQAVPAMRPALFDPGMLAHVEELRKFRHIAMQGYDAFQPWRAAPTVEAARAFLSGIDDAFVRFRAAIDPPP